jgi:hypothetical protein
MPLSTQDLQALCTPLASVSGSCLRFPGGAQICFNYPRIPSDDGEALRSLIAQANTSLAPLSPIFTLLDALLAVVDCVQGVPEAIVQLDPSKLIECIPNLAEKVAKVAALAPQLSLVAFLADLVELLALSMQAMARDLQRMATQQERILAAATNQAGRPGLLTAVACAQSNLDAELEMLNAANEPLNKLFGVVLGLLSVIGVPFDGTLSLDEIALTSIEETTAPILALADTLLAIRETIPI